jgi:phage shock protein PspC (stress-responsive transcriptional regulator)
MRKSLTNKWLFGIIAGIGERNRWSHQTIDLVRLLFLFICLFSFPAGFLIYIILGIFLD